MAAGFSITDFVDRVNPITGTISPSEEVKVPDVLGSMRPVTEINKEINKVVKDNAVTLEMVGTLFDKVQEDGLLSILLCEILEHQRIVGNELLKGTNGDKLKDQFKNKAVDLMIIWQIIGVALKSKSILKELIQEIAGCFALEDVYKVSGDDLIKELGNDLRRKIITKVTTLTQV